MKERINGVETEIRKDSSVKYGKAGESLVIEYLTARGFQILERNWRPAPTSKLEIDVIAGKGETIVFVEVKTREDEDSDPIEYIDKKKMLNISRAADSYLQQQDHLYEYRFDVAGITGLSGGNPEIEYIEDAFLSPFE